MAGTIGGLGYSQRWDANGRPLIGAKLYIYETGTSTPASVFQDYSLSIAHTHPIEVDSLAVIPMFWVADGTYRVRMTDVDGNELFDDDGIVAVGPSSGTGGGGGTTVASESLFNTGDIKWKPISGVETGWVRCNARTIGSAASGATERANADCEDLFLYLWTNFSNTICPVTGGRGGSAAADWAANKLIATLDMRYRGMMGLLGMGNTDLSLTGGSSTAADAIGSATTVLTQANLPSSINLSSTALSAIAQNTFDLTISRTITNGSSVARSLSISVSTGTAQAGGSQPVVTAATYSFSSDTLSLPSSVVSGTITSTINLSGTIPLGGSDSPITLTNRARVGTFYIKL